MKRAAMIAGLAYLWTLIASALFCVFDFRLFTFPFMQWWQGLYYLRNMLWWWWKGHVAFLQWPLFWFVDGFLVASLVVLVFGSPLLVRLWPRRNRQPNLYGTSEIAGPRAMLAGGITTEKRR